MRQSSSTRQRQRTHGVHQSNSNVSQRSAMSSGSSQTKNKNLKLSSQAPRIRTFPTNIHTTKEKSQKDWEILENAIQEIQRKNNSHLSFEHLYRTAYCMVLHQSGQLLYEGTKKTVEQHLVRDVRPVIMGNQDNKNKHAASVLKAWDDHRTSMTMIRDILMYMDRCFCENQRLDKVDIFGVKLYRDQIIQYTSIKNLLRDQVLEKISKSRQNLTQQNNSQLKEITNMLIELGMGDRRVYEEVLEKKFLDQTEVFYGSEANQMLSSISCIDYVRHVNKRMKEEEQRTRTYLDESSMRHVSEALIKNMVANHAEKIVTLETGASAMIDNDRLSDLNELRSLLQTSHNYCNAGLEPLLKVFEDKLYSAGEQIVKNPRNSKDAQHYIDELMTLKQRYDNIIEKALNKPMFKTSLTKKFEEFLNMEGAKTPEFLSIFIDKKMSKKNVKSSAINTGIQNDNGISGAFNLENSDFIEQCICLFRLLHEKDVFEKYYKKHLCTRMLIDKICDVDLEKEMIGKLQSECGASFTTKLNQMFSDKTKWEDCTQGYREFLNDKDSQPGNLDLSIKILTNGTWEVGKSPGSSSEKAHGKAGDTAGNNTSNSTSSSSNANSNNQNNANNASNGISQAANTNKKNKDQEFKYLPIEMQLAFASFKTYYHKNYDSRILTLIPEHGTGELKYLGFNGDDSKKYTITANTTRIVILLLFNKKTTWKLSDMLAALPELSDREVKEHLNGLANHPKSKILILQNDENRSETTERSAKSSSKQPESRQNILRAQEADKINVILNKNFTSRMVKLNLVAGNKTVKIDDGSSKSVKNTIEQDRKHEIEAAIVRIMKSRKKLVHNDLIVEVINQLTNRFKPQPTLIKQKVESLIEREYLKRSNGNMQQYEYIA